MKPKRFAFIAHSIFDERLGAGLCQALANETQQDCCLISAPQKSRESLAGFDVIMEPQHTRDDTIPKDAIYIAWCFEYYCAYDPDFTTLLDRDILYTLGDPDILSVPPFKTLRGNFAPGIDPALLQRPFMEPSLDMSLAGFLPPLTWFYWPRVMPGINRFDILAELTNLITQNTKADPLTGSFNQREEFGRFREGVAELLELRGWKLREGELHEIYSYGAKLLHQYARLMNRMTLAKLALQVTTDIEFWGQHWDFWAPTAKYAHPFTDNLATLHNLYQRSRINLYDNLFGFSIHWRVLEALALGSFVMVNESPHIGKAGQMTETFEPDVHFGQYNAHNFVHRAQYWLRNTEARNKAVEKARLVIADRHLWAHRAKQILADLARI